MHFSNWLDFFMPPKVYRGIKYFLFVPEQFYVINNDKG